MKEFEDWEATTNKMWTSLNEFIHGAFQHRHVAVGICSTLAQHGYAPANNNYTMLANKFVDLDNDTFVEHTADGVTAGSMLGNKYATPAPMRMMTNGLTSAINLLAANQQALNQHITPLLQHMAVVSFHVQPLLQARVFPTPNTTPYYVPPIQQLTVPGMPQGGSNQSPLAFVAGGFNPGQGGHSNRGPGQGCGCRGCGRTPFVNHMAAQRGGFQGAGRASFQDIGGDSTPCTK